MCGGEFLSTNMTSTNGNRSRDLSLPRTKYLKHTLHLTLEEMYNGTTRKLAVNKNVVCDLCQGSGSASEVPEDYDTCEECSGLGVRTVFRRTAPDLEEQIERDCELCWGKGEAVISVDRCRKCRGRKTVPEQSILIVRVKRGTRHGQKIIYKDEGTQEPNMRTGDIVVILEAIDHHTFTREGDDLLMTMHLDLVESLCGFEKLVTTLDKRQLSIISPRGKVIKNDDVKYLVGEGVPKFKNPNERGKLIIQFQVNLPSTIRARHVPSLEKCLPPRQKVDIPMDAVECNMVHMATADEVYEDQNHTPFDQNEEDYGQEQNYDQQYEGHDQYTHENGMHQYGPDEQFDQGQYYQDENSYEVQGNYEHPSEYDQHYNHNQQGYDSHYQKDDIYQQEDDSLESYDATQQYRFHD